jgi:hypothetical protein
VEDAWVKGVTAAVPKIEGAAKALAPKVDVVRDAIVERALPAVVAAAEAAARAATGQEIAATKKAQRRRTRRIVGWSLFAAALSGIGYWLWRQTRPITDPWAEDEWGEFEAPPEEDLADAAGDAAEAVGEAAGQAVKAVTDAAKKTGDAIKRAGDAVKKAASDAASTEDESRAEE